MTNVFASLETNWLHTATLQGGLVEAGEGMPAVVTATMPAVAMLVTVTATLAVIVGIIRKVAS